MVFSFFNKRDSKKHTILLVDVGSSSIGIALARIESGKAPHILFTIREDIKFQEALSSAKFLLAMNHALERALKATQTKIKQTGINAGDSTDIFCTLSSPWFLLKSRQLLISEKEPFKVTERSLQELLDKDIENLKVELKETLPPSDIAIIERKIIQIKLNGYEIKNPYGQTTSQMQLSMTIGVSSEKVIQSIRRKLGQFFHSQSIHFGVFPISAFSTIRDIFPTEKSFLFLDITGEATDVSVVGNDLLTGATSFPLGRNIFIRDISTKFSTPHEEAATLFRMFLRKELPTDKYKQIESVVNNTASKWIARFEKTIKSLIPSGAVPKKIFFTTDSDISDFFSNLMIMTMVGLHSKEKFDVQYLDQHIISKFVSFEPNTVRDPFIVTEVLLAEKVISHNY